MAQRNRRNDDNQKCKYLHRAHRPHLFPLA
nr:MAG TPA: hypothetical protein [Caudoviricetes sp.]